MKKAFMFVALALSVALLCLSLVAACGTECPVGKTLIRGKIYMEDTGDKVKEAEVTVICHGVNGDVSNTTQSGLSGRYRVIFSQNDCDYGDNVTVNAQKDGLTGENTGTVDKQVGRGCLEKDIGIVNVPLIPEFGLLVGGLTVVSSIVIFFLVRRK